MIDIWAYLIELKQIKKLYNNREIEVNPIKIEKYKKYVRREKVKQLFKDRETKEEILSKERRGKTSKRITKDW